MMSWQHMTLGQMTRPFLLKHRLQVVPVRGKQQGRLRNMFKNKPGWQT